MAECLNLAKKEILEFLKHQYNKYMKLSQNLMVALFLAATLFFGACAADRDAEKAAAEFYNLLEKKDYDAIMPMIDSAAIKNVGEANLKKLMSSRNEYWGAIKSRKKYTSQVVEGDSIILASINYLVVSERDTVYELLEFIKEHGEYKITTYAFSAIKEDVTPQISTEEETK